MKRVSILACVLFMGALAACGDDGKTGDDGMGSGSNLFPPKPECEGDPVVPFAGNNPQVISTLSIGSLEDGFDLDGDGKPDNKLAAVGSLAKSAIQDSFKDYSIVIPIEFFDVPAVQADTCVKFAIYLGDYVTDKDGDGKKSYVSGGDCNDNDAAIPGTEIVGDFKDNDCDGLADEAEDDTPSADTMDRDGDGFSMAQGDCDDNDDTVFPGAPEICGDGKDNDCDGVADRSPDPSQACSPYDPATPADIPLDPLSFVGTDPAITYKDGVISAGPGGGLVLDAGPDLFGVNIPVTGDITLQLKITGATIHADVVPMGNTFVLSNAKLGGVIDAKTADTIRGLDVAQIGLTPENSLLDATFANLLGPLLALPNADPTVTAMFKGCRTPDIDVDGDGLEAFCDSNPDDDDKSVDICIDGDGTIVMDSENPDGTIKQCTEALDDNGKPRFVDGISVELNFATTPVHALLQPPGS